MKNNSIVEGPTVTLGRHRSQCSVCSHPQCQEIEREWINWGNTTELSHRYGLSRDSVYRHMHALNLFRKRQRNLKAALEKMIERTELAPVTGSAIIAAIKAYISLSARDDTKQENGLSAIELFRRMSKQERKTFARDGSLPDWFSSELSDPPQDSQGDGKDVPAEGCGEADQDAPTSGQDDQERL